MADNAAPIIIIKKIKKAGHAHHGGAWKVAYADFVTAMMAFFLLMWLLNMATDDQKRGIADYFTPATVSKSRSGAGGLLGGRSIASPGSMQTRSAAPSFSVDLQPTSGASDGQADDDTGSTGEKDLTKLNSDDLDEALAKREEELFAKAEEELRKAILDSPDLQSLAKHLLVDRTQEGLRIQIIDREGQPMFPIGSASMFERTRLLIGKISQVILDLPNKISISGHTDSTRFRGKRADHGNWELSTGRALSSRRALVAGGLPVARIVSVVGKADTDPLVPDDPTSASNRRIAIVLLREAGAGKGQAKTARTAPKEGFKRNWSGPRLR